MEEDEVSEKLEAMKEEREAELEKLKGEMQEIEDRQKVLKGALYARFGKSINLEA